MTSPDRLGEADEQFDRIVHQAIAESVETAEPAPRLRSAILRAAAAERRLAAEAADQRHLAQTANSFSSSWHERGALAVGNSLALGMLQTHLLKSRSVL